MYTKKISSTDKEFHDNPPQFKAVDRKRFFYVESHFKQLISQNVRGHPILFTASSPMATSKPQVNFLILRSRKILTM
ncbi:MAG: hypothetical protein COA68_16295 [Oceanobacter sp.]|jgi:hypothetical protein|nr:MAG: hypothetical protein COA68_16295 [Oceanobacter sp.]